MLGGHSVRCPPNSVKSFARIFRLPHKQLCWEQSLGQTHVYIGALGRSRTDNLLIRSQMLYPLSYERLTVYNPTCQNGSDLPVTPMAPNHCADIGDMRQRRLGVGQTFGLDWLFPHSAATRYASGSRSGRGRSNTYFHSVPTG